MNANKVQTYIKKSRTEYDADYFRSMYTAAGRVTSLNKEEENV